MNQPEALRLADELDAYHTRSCHKEAAAELRRLHAENENLRQIVQDFPPVEAELREVSDRAHRLEQQRDALLEALRKIAAIGNKMWGTDWEEIDEAREIARAAIAKAEEQT